MSGTETGSAATPQVQEWLTGLGYAFDGLDFEPTSRDCDPPSLVEWELAVYDKVLAGDGAVIPDEDECDVLAATDRSEHEVVVVVNPNVGHYDPEYDLNEGLNLIRTYADAQRWHQWAEARRFSYWTTKPYVLMARRRIGALPGTDPWACPQCEFNLAIPRNPEAHQQATAVISMHMEDCTTPFTMGGCGQTISMSPGVTKFYEERTKGDDPWLAQSFLENMDTKPWDKPFNVLPIKPKKKKRTRLRVKRSK